MKEKLKKLSDEFDEFESSTLGACIIGGAALVGAFMLGGKCGRRKGQVEGMCAALQVITDAATKVDSGSPIQKF